MNVGIKVHNRNLMGQYLRISSSTLFLTIFKILTVSNYVEVELQDFKTVHMKFIMLLRLSEYKNRQTSNTYNFGCGCPIFKKLVLSDQKKKSSISLLSFIKI